MGSKVKSKMTSSASFAENVQNEQEAWSVNKPAHYTMGKIECIDVIEDQQMTFNIASCLQYLWRYRYKKNEILDLKKAKWYLEREIMRLHRERGKRINDV